MILKSVYPAVSSGMSTSPLVDVLPQAHNRALSQYRILGGRTYWGLSRLARSDTHARVARVTRPQEAVRRSLGHLRRERLGGSEAGGGGCRALAGSGFLPGF